MLFLFLGVAFAQNRQQELESQRELYRVFGPAFVKLFDLFAVASQIFTGFYFNFALWYVWFICYLMYRNEIYKGFWLWPFFCVIAVINIFWYIAGG